MGRRPRMGDESAYRKMIEGKISSKKYASELEKEVRRERNASTGRFRRRDRVGRQASA
jgi:hypothetical protein